MLACRTDVSVCTLDMLHGVPVCILEMLYGVLVCTLGMLHGVLFRRTLGICTMYLFVPWHWECCTMYLFATGDAARCTCLYTGDAERTMYLLVHWTCCTLYLFVHWTCCTMYLFQRTLEMLPARCTCLPYGTLGMLHDVPVCTLTQCCMTDQCTCLYTECCTMYLSHWECCTLYLFVHWRCCTDDVLVPIDGVQRVFHILRLGVLHALHILCVGE